MLSSTTIQHHLIFHKIFEFIVLCVKTRLQEYRCIQIDIARKHGLNKTHLLYSRRARFRLWPGWWLFRPVRLNVLDHLALPQKRQVPCAPLCLFLVCLKSALHDQKLGFSCNLDKQTIARPRVIDIQWKKRWSVVLAPATSHSRLFIFQGIRVKDKVAARWTHHIFTGCIGTSAKFKTLYENPNILWLISSLD